MEKSFAVYEHGIDKLIARSGKMRGDEALVRLELPRERRATDLTVQIAPSLAVTMLDALPYLVEFPYGCTEQTMSRFLPAAIVARTLEKLGLEPRRASPKKNLDAVTAAGMARLYDIQHGDGGWGWWKEGTSDDFMTAYVVWGFASRATAGLTVDTARVDRAADVARANVSSRTKAQWQRSGLDAPRALRRGATSRRPRNARAFDNVWKHRERLTAYSRALLALAAHRYGDTERARHPGAQSRGRRADRPHARPVDPAERRDDRRDDGHRALGPRSASGGAGTRARSRRRRSRCARW